MEAASTAEFQMTPGMESLVVTFLLKMSFVLTDGIKDPKDREAAALVKHNQILFSQALALWPTVCSLNPSVNPCALPLRIVREGGRLPNFQNDPGSRVQIGFSIRISS